MRDIDWMSVDNVVSGIKVRGKLNSDEKRMVIRRLRDRMLRGHESWVDSTKWTASEVAWLLNTTDRSIARYIAELPEASKRVCPVCRGDMWVADGIVEPHPDSLYNDCPMSGRDTRKGLASLRPDLYRWAEGVAS